MKYDTLAFQMRAFLLNFFKKLVNKKYAYFTNGYKGRESDYKSPSGRQCSLSLRCPTGCSNKESNILLTPPLPYISEYFKGTISQVCDWLKV